MSKKNLFGNLFGGGREPQPIDVANLSTAIAGLQGRRRGIEDVAVRAVMEQMAGPAAVADMIGEAIGGPLDEALGTAGAVARAVVGAANQAILDQLRPIHLQAIRLGYQPAAPFGEGAGEAKGKRRRRGRRVQEDEAAPPDQQGVTGDPAGAPGQAEATQQNLAGQQAGAALAQLIAQALRQLPPGTTTPAGNGGGPPVSGTGGPTVPQVTGFTGPGYAGEGPHGATATFGPGGAQAQPQAVGPDFGGGPVAPQLPIPPLGPLPGGPPAVGGGFGLPPDEGAPAGQPGALPVFPIVNLTQPLTNTIFPQYALPPVQPVGTLPYPVGGPIGVPPFPPGGGAIPPWPPGPIGPVPPVPGGGGTLPIQPTTPGGGAGPPGGPGGGAGGGPVGGGGGGGGGPGGGPGGGAGGGAVGPPIVVNVQPAPVNLTCPAPQTTVQCPACGQLGQLPAVAAPPAAPPSVTINAPVTVGGPTVLPGLVEENPPPVTAYAGPTFSPLVPPELALGQLPGGGGGAPPAGGGAAPPVPEAELQQFVEQASTTDQITTECLPPLVARLAKAFAGRTIVDLLRASGFLDGEGRQKWILEVEERLKNDHSITADLERGLAATGAQAFHFLVEALDWLRQNFNLFSACGTSEAGLALVVQAFLGIWRRWVGELPHELTAPWDTFTRWACPQELPTQAEADEARLRGVIDVGTWECLTRANGNNVKAAVDVYSSRLPWPGIEDVIRLERRGVFSEGFRRFLWKRNGVQLTGQKEAFRRAADYVPTPSEAAEWMGKDLGDPLLTQTFGLFNEFRQKYRGKVKEAFDQNGIPEEWARIFFAGHRRGVSPHQVYDMHKRLRPGWWAQLPDADALEMAQAIAPRRPQGEGGLLEQASNLQFLAQQREVGALYGSDPAALERFGKAVWVKPVVSPDPQIPVPADLAGLPPQWLDEIGDSAEAARAFLAETVTTGFHAFEALSQSNYPPFWRARLLALSYNVLTRVDMRRAYETGQLTKAQLVEKLQDRGYTITDSKYLAEFYEVAAAQLASRRPAVTAWVNDGYDMGLLQQALLDQGMRPEMWPAVKRTAETRRQILVQQRCIRHLKKLVLAGVVEEAQILPRLESIGLTAPEAARLRGEWACEMRAIPKAETAAQVCKYLKQNLIGPDHAARLIHRAGYTWPQARRMVGSCLLDPPRKGMGHRKDLPAAEYAARAAAPPGDDEAPTGPPPGLP